jgi:hypothetical protein
LGEDGIDRQVPAEGGHLVDVGVEIHDHAGKSP